VLLAQSTALGEGSPSHPPTHWQPATCSPNNLAYRVIKRKNCIKSERGGKGWKLDYKQVREYELTTVYSPLTVFSTFLFLSTHFTPYVLFPLYPSLSYLFFPFSSLFLLILSLCRLLDRMSVHCTQEPSFYGTGVWASKSAGYCTANVWGQVPHTVHRSVTQAQWSLTSTVADKRATSTWCVIKNGSEGGKKKKSKNIENLSSTHLFTT
jgi:hypothetical protein